jgi:O-antigen ligase
VAAYLMHYHTYPERSWWGAGLAESGVRYSFTISLLLVIGTIIHWRRLPFRQLLKSQEVLLGCFVGWLFVSRTMFPVAPSVGGDASTDPVEKILKLSMVLFCFTHIVVTERLFHRLTQVFVLCALYLGYQAFAAPASAYEHGRLEGNGYVGGPDFAASNELAAHFLFLTIIVGVEFLRSPGWKARLLPFCALGLCANAIVQTRSRGAFIAGVVGLALTLLLAPKDKRRFIWVAMVLGLMAFSTRIDSGFLERMDSIEVSAQQQKDESAESRLEIWRGTLELVRANPLGVGPGNFHSRIGDYSPDHRGRDTHNTYLRCLAELGFPGLLIFGLLIANAVRTLGRSLWSLPGHPAVAPCRWYAYALLVALLTYLASALFGSYIYLETLWFLLLLPTGLERAFENAQEAYETARSGLDDESAEQSADGGLGLAGSVHSGEEKGIGLIQ